MKIKILSEAVPSVKKAPVKKSQDPAKNWKDLELDRPTFFLALDGHPVGDEVRSALEVAEYIKTVAEMGEDDMDATDEIDARSHKYFHWSYWKEFPAIVKAWEKINKKDDKGEMEVEDEIEEYMTNEYVFRTLDGKGDQRATGEEIAKKAIKYIDQTWWVIKKGVGWFKAHEHSEIAKIIQWLEQEGDTEEKPKDSNQRIFYFKKDKAWLYPSDNNTTGKWTAMEIAEYLRGLTDDEMMDHKWTAGDTTGAKTKWADVAEQPLIDAASMWLMKNSNKFGQDYKDEKKGKITISKYDFKDTSLAANSWIMGNVLYQVPGKYTPKKDVGYKVLQYFMRTLEDIKVSTQDKPPWRSIMDVGPFSVAYRHMGGSWPPKIKKRDVPSSQVQTIDGIKVLIGSKTHPCTAWSPENSEKPLGNKQFDPQSPEGINRGDWECNTKLEQEILHVLEDFVTANSKPEQEIIDAIINMARKSSPEEPLYPEDDVSVLYRGSSREDLSGAPYSPQALEVLKAIDWSKETESFYFDKNKWVKFKYSGKFDLAFPVASWTDQRITAAQFAKGGPAQNMAGARPFQFIYETPPSAAKAAGGTFIDFEELYKLQGNPKSTIGGKDVTDMFHGFGGYEAFDNEVLLLGQAGGSMSVEYVWVNWDFLTSKKTKGMLHKGAQDILKKIVNLEKASPDLRKVAAFEHYELWYDAMFGEAKHLIMQWKTANDQLKSDFEKAREMKGDPRSDGGIHFAAAQKKLQRKYPKKWFTKYEDMAKDLYGDVEQVYSRHRFEHKNTIWNQNPKHPWYNLPHSVLMSSGEDVKESMLQLQDKIQWLGSQIRAAMNVVYDPESWVQSGGGEFPDPYAEGKKLEESRWDDMSYDEAMNNVQLYINARWMWPTIDDGEDQYIDHKNPLYVQWDRLEKSLMWPWWRKKQDTTVEEEIAKMWKLVDTASIPEQIKTEEAKEEIEAILAALFNKNEPLEEEKEPWYKTKAKDEIAKGMRGTLTGASAGNKFMPATGMKDASTNKKSKSAPPNVGALEEECGPIMPSITLKIR